MNKGFATQNVTTKRKFHIGVAYLPWHEFEFLIKLFRNQLMILLSIYLTDICQRVCNITNGTFVRVFSY